ncbi:MAG: DUF882 domain-containing protein [Hyphomicrobiaceae bacterium]|nr:DUF882 domain-containing protein [Hyphomicrobiaceae bacterium]
MSSRHRGLLAGTAAAALLAAAGAIGHVVAQAGERSISIHNIHTKETVTAVFKRGGKFDAAGLEKINHIMRDHRRNEATRMDPELVDLIWEMHRELGSQEPVHLVSGYRSRATNEMLRKTNGGQASESRHILGKAADVHFPDVPIKKLRYAALVHERGGVGYYPTSALPFVHVDTDRVRSWPRLPRQELALLFPSGSTRHAPADGGPITRDDVRIAQSRNQVLAAQIAAFHGERAGGGSPVALADARPAARSATERVAALPGQIVPAPPSLVEQPRLAALPARLTVPMGPSSGDRARLAELSGLASLPQLIAGPMPARRPAKPALPSLAESGLPVPPSGVVAHGASLPAERRVASIDPVVAPGDNITDSGGRFGWGAWVPAPAYDDEHPEELSYRPFPIVPYLTETASEPLMHQLVAHDVSRTVEILDQPDSAPTLRFRPTSSAATLLWAQQFTGAAVAIDKLREAQAIGIPATASGLRSRAVRTSSR